MARKVVGAIKKFKSFFKKVTAIGNSVRTRPKNKHKRQIMNVMVLSLEVMQLKNYLTMID